MNELNEIECGQLCQSTIESLYEATGGLKSFPGLLKKIILNKAWERRTVKGRVVELKSLRELITLKPFQGWGEEPKKVEAVIKDDAEVLTMFREAMLGEHGGDRKSESRIKSDIVTLDGRGNTKSYTLSRLEKESPELFHRVIAGELSANAAAIEAGFRTKTVTMPLEPKRAAETLKRHFTKKQIKAIIEALEG